MSQFRGRVRNSVLGIILLQAATPIFLPGMASAITPLDKGAPPSDTTGLPLNFARHTDDLDAMVKRRNIRALVLYSRSGFFYVNGRPQGIYYEALRAFEQAVNQKLQTGKQPVQVTFIPVRPTRLKRP